MARNRRHATEGRRRRSVRTRSKPVLERVMPPTVRPSGACQWGLSRKLWTTRDLQLAAAAGALLAGFESEEDEDDEVVAAGVEDVVDDVLLDEPERLSVR
ncbi:hypothetical protein C8D87_106424 [Lentzea atacamensis]|uniref:Uncharacterized protein n=1 Tax=Lentzea atacamensis TaxID=531938 RepID=A0ABX9E4P9_9PSEU|nr:hypothetical protein C8D87_106424 [Lentzea atacamensis]